MDKDEILEKSRQENKGQDVYENQIMQKGASLGTTAAAILATIFFVVQIFTGGGQNYGLYAVVCSIMATNFIVKSLYLKRRHEIAVAALYTLLTLGCSAAHIYNLVTAASVR